MFVREYLLDLNATQAAIRAGYSAKTAHAQASRLLKTVNVIMALDEARRRRDVRIEITRERVIQELALIAFSDITNYVVDDTGNVVLAKGAPPGAMRAISSLKRRVHVGEDGTSSVDVELKLWDKPAPLKLAGRHVGLFANKDTEAIQLLAEKIVTEMLERARAQKAAQTRDQAQQKAIEAVGTDEG